MATKKPISISSATGSSKSGKTIGVGSTGVSSKKAQKAVVSLNSKNKTTSTSRVGSMNEDQAERTEKGKKLLLMTDALMKYINALNDLQLQAQNTLDSTTLTSLVKEFKTYRTMINTARDACQSAKAIENYDKCISAGEKAMERCNDFAAKVQKEIAAAQKNAKNTAAAKGRSKSLR